MKKKYIYNSDMKRIIPKHLESDPDAMIYPLSIKDKLLLCKAFLSIILKNYGGWPVSIFFISLLILLVIDHKAFLTLVAFCSILYLFVDKKEILRGIRNKVYVKLSRVEKSDHGVEYVILLDRILYEMPNGLYSSLEEYYYFVGLKISELRYYPVTKTRKRDKIIKSILG